MLTINDTLTNPTGKGSGFVSARYAIIDDLKRRYEIIKSDIKRGEAGHDDGSTYLHLRIPSEKDKYLQEKMYYDVVLKLTQEDDVKTGDLVLEVYSNSPAFTFTYCYVLNNSGDLIPEFKPKCSKEALKDAPSERNPLETWGFEKSVYFSLLYLKEKKMLLGNNLFTAVQKEIKVKDLLEKIPSADSKLDEYNKIKSKVVKANKRAKAKAKREQSSTSKKMTRTTKSRSMKSAKGLAKTTKQTGTVKSTKVR